MIRINVRTRYLYVLDTTKSTGGSAFPAPSQRSVRMLACDVLARPCGHGHDRQRRADRGVRHEATSVRDEEVRHVPGLVVLVHDRLRGVGSYARSTTLVN